MITLAQSTNLDLKQDINTLISLVSRSKLELIISAVKCKNIDKSILMQLPGLEEKDLIIKLNQISRSLFKKDFSDPNTPCVIDLNQIKKLANQETIYEKFSQQANNQLRQILCSYEILSEIQNDTLNFDSNRIDAKQGLELLTSSFRNQINIIAGIIIALNSYSPVVDSSLVEQPESINIGVKTVRDYMRTAPDEQLLFSSGMAAWKTIQTFLSVGSKRGGGKNIILFDNANPNSTSPGAPYFEILSSVDNSELDLVVSPDLERLRRNLIQKQVIAVVTAPVCLNSSLSVVDLPNVIEAIPSRNLLIIDGSLCGKELPADIVKQIEEKNLPTIYFYSSSKLMQHGFDLTGGGVIKLYGMDEKRSKTITDNLNAARAVAGNGISEHSKAIFYLLDIDNPSYLDTIRLNTILSATTINDFISNDGKYPFKVHSPYLVSHRGHSLMRQEYIVPLFLMEPKILSSVDKKIDLAKSFVDEVIRIASDRKIPINTGASFGHRVTRIDYYQDASSEVRIRISPGIEDNFEPIIDVLKTALCKFNQ